MDVTEAYKQGKVLLRYLTSDRCPSLMDPELPQFMRQLFIYSSQDKEIRNIFSSCMKMCRVRFGSEAHLALASSLEKIE